MVLLCGHVSLRCCGQRRDLLWTATPPASPFDPRLTCPLSTLWVCWTMASFRHLEARVPEKVFGVHPSRAGPESAPRLLHYGGVRPPGSSQSGGRVDKTGKRHCWIPLGAYLAAYRRATPAGVSAPEWCLRWPAKHTLFSSRGSGLRGRQIGVN